MHSVILVLTTPTVTNVCDGPCTMTVQINCSENRIKYLSTYSQLSNDIMQARQCDHFTLMLHQLCWLPVQRRWSTRSHAWCNIHCLARHLCISSIYRPRLWQLLLFAPMCVVQCMHSSFDDRNFVLLVCVWSCGTLCIILALGHLLQTA